MTILVKVSSKGQIVIPKDVRERLGLRKGETMELIEQGARVFLQRATASEDTISWDEFCKQVPAYKGKPKTIEEISELSDEALWEIYGKGQRARG